MSTTTRGWLINQLKGVIVVETWIDECRDEIFSNDLRQFLRRYLSLFNRSRCLAVSAQVVVIMKCQTIEVVHEGQ